MIDSFVSLGAEKDINLKHLHAKELSRQQSWWLGHHLFRTVYQCWKEAAETCDFPSVHLKLYSELEWATSSISRVLN